MEAPTASSATNTSADAHGSGTNSYPLIPPQLKFLLGNIKSIISLPLTADIYPMWRSQVFKIFKANGFEGFLDGSSRCPSPTESSSSSNNFTSQSWNLIDQNLAAALYSIISPSLLPYVLNLEHCCEIWETLDHRLQSSSRSRTIQLRNELNSLSMKNQTMSQFLLTVKTKVDAIAATGSPLTSEEVIFYTLNGLPAQYQAFKTAIRTNLQPISIDDLYTLLCSEEQNLAQEAIKDLQTLQISDPSVALYSSRGRGRSRGDSSRGRPPSASRNFRSNTRRSDKNTSNPVTCQICSKFGHSALRCWYRNDPSYTEESQLQKTALFSPSDSTSPSDWYLDSGASTHLTSDISQIQSVKSYSGPNQVTLGNGYQVPIQHSGKGVLPTPQGLDDGSSSTQGTLP
ncbi:Retrovirus-related Pol polyprotein from transposon TNT 1-94 [Dendrobium catenatum]|uniref:Retrovirus-related Pol polyprotein from transposon TNT 1-94 n=1 Tax=Dendrobium catenatum TaxID=906689 RepID=A0A2I0WWU7_9ASPA|nr:Retrovirus-related Pol polyprotein from transposon TNT 1-94 [Dendrobium catenatum]